MLLFLGFWLCADLEPLLHFSSLVSSFLKDGRVHRTKDQACYCCCWDFQEGIPATVGDHAPVCTADIQHTPLPQPFTHLWAKLPLTVMWNACGWVPEHFSIACLPLNLAIAMDQLWQLMRAFGESWEFSGIQCKLNISPDICRILYVLTKPLQFWCLSVSLT